MITSVWLEINKITSILSYWLWKYQLQKCIIICLCSNEKTWNLLKSFMQKFFIWPGWKFYMQTIRLHDISHNKTFAAFNKFAMNHHQKSNKFKCGPPFILLWLAEVHDCSFFNWIQRPSQSCSLLNVEWLIKFEDKVQSLIHVWWAY